MTYILKNEHLEIHMDHPLEQYNFSRFDWTGKIRLVKYKGVLCTGREKAGDQEEFNFGQGFYNEFDIDEAIGYDDVSQGDSFHKIGIGHLIKDADPYLFSNTYEIEPAYFQVEEKPGQLLLSCTSKLLNGYSYTFHKTITLKEHSFTIDYHVLNTGVKLIETSEYVHNFIAIDKALIGSQYQLSFSFDLSPNGFEAVINPKQCVQFNKRKITFSETPSDVFFFSHLNGNKQVEASWELINWNSKLAICETGDFRTRKVNLWGDKHVISPELFIDVSIAPGASRTWSRTYTFRQI